MGNVLWWLGTMTLVVACWLGMEQLTWMQELRPGADSMVRIGLSVVVLSVAAALNLFGRTDEERVTTG